jgi:hypothetical protein
VLLVLSVPIILVVPVLVVVVILVVVPTLVVILLSALLIAVLIVVRVTLLVVVVVKLHFTIQYNSVEWQNDCQTLHCKTSIATESRYSPKMSLQIPGKTREASNQDSRCSAS